MNTKDIQIGKYYSYKIWEDEAAIYYKCTGKEDECFFFQECPPYGYDFDKNEREIYPVLIMDINQEDSNLKEIHEMQYFIRSVGMQIEENTIANVLNNS